MSKRSPLLFLLFLFGAGLSFADSSPSSGSPFEGSKPEKLLTGFGFTEGPVVDGQGNVLFTDMTKNLVYLYSPKTKKVFVLRKNTQSANGLALDNRGRLLSCEQDSHRITRLHKDGKLTVLADQFDGKPLNSPNDICALTNGLIYFTDPGWSDHPPQKIRGVYCILPDGKLKRVEDNLAIPNGIQASHDQTKLYVGDTAENKVMVYDIATDGSLKNASVFARINAPDGISTDNDGNVYVARWGFGEIGIFSSEGKSLGVIAVPENKTSNCTFNGDDFSTLYITAGRSLYRIKK